MIKPACIDNIRETVSLVDVASAYCQLKRMGSQYRGLSPFNEEKSPSFYIHPEKNVFKCYSSGHAGDLFRFVMLRENLPFNEAVEFIAQRFNVPIEYEEAGAKPEAVSLKKELFLIHEIAADFYKSTFWAATADGEFIRKYWAEDRGFSLDTAKALGIGLSPKNDSGLLDQFYDKKISSEALKQCGIFYNRDHAADGRPFKARFRGRLMIPIRDVQGRIVAFTARVLPITPQDDPTLDAKYVNSPETPLFTKSNIVFGLDHARTHVKDLHTSILIVEGQLDAIRCWQNGLNTAVAPQGTSITMQQLMLLRRYSHRVDIVMDGDAAGARAALRVLPMTIEAGLEAHFIALPEGEDPDTIFKNGDKSKWESIVKNRQDAIEFAIHALAPEGRLASPHTKETALRKLFEFYSHVESFALAESALKRAASLLGISEYAIDQQLPLLKQNKPTLSPLPQQDSKYLTSYADILLIALSSDARIVQALSDTLDGEWIRGGGLSSLLLDRLLAAYREGLWLPPVPPSEFLETDAERNHYYSLLARDDLHLDNLEKAAQEALRALFERHFNQRKERLTRALAHVDPADHAALQQLQSERIQIRNCLKHPPVLNIR